VDFQIFRSGKYFSTTGEWTRKRFLPGVHSNVIHKFIILCFKRFPFPGTLFPKANVIRLLWSPNVLHRQVGHKLVHGAESFVAGLFRIRQLLRFDPFADELLLYGLSHVPKEGPCPVMSSHVHVHGAIAVQLSRRIMLGPRTRDVTILLGPPVHVPGKAQAHLTVHHVGGRVRGRLLVQSREEQVPSGVRVSMWPGETSSGGGEETVLRTRGVSEPPISKEKVPSGVEGGGGVRADMSGVMMVSQGSGGGVTGGLRGKRRLARAKIVGAVVDFKSAHTVGERIDTQSHFSVCNFAC